MSTDTHTRHRGLFSAEKAAEYLGVAISTVKAWTYKGMLPYVKLGEGKHAPLRFRWEDFGAFIDEHWFPMQAKPASPRLPPRPIDPITTTHLSSRPAHPGSLLPARLDPWKTAEGDPQLPTMIPW